MQTKFLVPVVCICILISEIRLDLAGLDKVLTGELQTGRPLLLSPSSRSSSLRGMIWQSASPSMFCAYYAVVDNASGISTAYIGRDFARGLAMACYLTNEKLCISPTRCSYLYRRSVRSDIHRTSVRSSLYKVKYSPLWSAFIWSMHTPKA